MTRVNGLGSPEAYVGIYTHSLQRTYGVPYLVPGPSMHIYALIQVMCLLSANFFFSS